MGPGDSPDRLAAAVRGFTPEDWGRFLRELNGFRLGPLFYWKYRARAEEIGIPADVLARTRDAYCSNLARNVPLFNELKKVLLAFGDAGIPVIVLKGAHIAALVYGDIGARPMRDLDILVRTENLAKVDEVLIGLGFRSCEFRPDPPPEGNAFRYVHDRIGLLIEVHWRLFSDFYPFRFDQEALWSSAGETELEGAPALVLAAEDLLLHISVHTCIHMFHSGLRDLCDVAEIVRLGAGMFDWVRVRERALSWEAENPVYLVILLAVRLLGATIPEDLLHTFRSAGFDESFYEVGKRAVLSNGLMSGRGPFPTLNIVLFVGRKGIGPKFGVLIKKVFPSRSTLAAFYRISPLSRCLPCYYFRWIWRLIRANVPGAWQLLADRVRGRKSGPVSELAPLVNWLIAP